MENEPTHLDLFSGIGGFALAAKWAGFRTVGFSEVEPYCQAVLKKHWPGVPQFGDITRFADWPDLGNVSLITGGFPCQPFSVAGKRRGASDDRFLWPAMLGVIGRYRPDWVLGENVPGLIGMELERCLADLESLGFRTATLVIPACAVDAPHRRDRVWIVGWNANSMRCGWDSGQERGIQKQDAKPNGICKTVAHAAGIGGVKATQRCEQTKPVPELGRQEPRSLANPIGSRLEEQRQQPARKECKAAERGGEAGPAIWPTEPDVGRVAHGIPRMVDRLKGLGNAIVPQVAYQILKAIRELIV